MSKAVFVMDMPGSCAECRLRVNKPNVVYCAGMTGVDRMKPTGYFERSEQCPLKPLPERASKDKTKIYTTPLNPEENDGTTEGVWCVGGGRNDDFDTGWNACLEVIGGENSEAN